MSDVGGTVEPGFEKVREAFAEGQTADEGGAQLCVYRGGRKVVDLWTGRDTVKDRPYTDQTLAVMMSVSKGAVATAAHMLAERGLLDLDAPVTTYWPAFGRNGKEGVTVADLLTHRAGLSSFGAHSGVGPRELLDWDKCTEALAAMAPLWPPGTAFMYHAVTYGYLVGEVIRRVSGKTPGRFLAEEIAAPLGLDLWIGLAEAEEDRVAPYFSRRPGLTLEQWTMLLNGFGIDAQSPLARAMTHGLIGTAEAVAIINSREGHAAQIPAANMIGTAASLARMYAATIGEVDGVRLLQPRTVARAMAPRTEGLTVPGDFAKLPNPSPLRYGLGFQLTRSAAPMLGEGSFGHDGAGGRIGFAHPQSGVAVGYVCNNMLWDGMRGPDDRWVGWTAALKDVVGV
ncbi:MAG: serine hydrolase domain-containing protein [Rhizomicrobium sp.]